jgi:branched-chain amino acid transport system ATP-binding protein
VTHPPVLATRNLGLDIGGARIVADVSLEVPAGELLGIIGPNGAGKTTLFNLLSGLYRPTPQRRAGRAPGWAGRSRSRASSRS